MLHKVVAITKRGKVVMGVMEKIYSRQISITVENLPQTNQFAESSTSINE